MCDEYEQKTQRLRALQHRIEEVKKQHGEYAMSGERERERAITLVTSLRGCYHSPPLIGQAVQNFYDSLEMKDSEIYCQRAKKLYGSPESLQKSSLFQFSMSGVKIMAMFDPSMQGRGRLVECIREIDSIR